MKIKTKNLFYQFVIIVSVLIYTSACKKYDFTSKPILEINEVRVITQSSAIIDCNILSEGGAAITNRGVCWSKNANPDITDSIIENGTGLGFFTITINKLKASTTYYVRAYATNSDGTFYGNQLRFTTGLIIEVVVVDRDSNIYHTVNIGSQVWMVENLKSTKYNDGTTIPKVSVAAAWGALTSPAYCWYDNDSVAYSATYGALYNWYTVNTGKLCPKGWHVPNDAEWQTLVDYLGGMLAASGKLKETGTTHWFRPNTAATNESGFTAVAGGWRYSDGAFNYINISSYWWSATKIDANHSWLWNLDFNNNEVFHFFNPWDTSPSNRVCGASVRCIKD